VCVFWYICIVFAISYEGEVNLYECEMSWDEDEMS
jgi:hypothetical protein